MEALKISNVRVHDLRRTFVFVHVQAGTHPKVVQERLGHDTFKVTWDLYGKMAGKSALTPDQRARLDGVATRALPGEVSECARLDVPIKHRKERLKGRRLGTKPGHQKKPDGEAK